MTTTASTHGMEGRLVEPDWRPLELAELRRLLAGFARVGAVEKILSCSPRPFSAASTIAAEKGVFFVKRHHRAVRDREGLLEEHRFLRHLRAHGGEVTSLVADEAGETAIELDEWTYEVHALPPGVDLYVEAISWTPFFSAAHARSAGAALARLHRAAEGYMAPARKRQPLTSGFSIYASADPERALRGYLAARPSIAQDAETARCGALALELLEPYYAEIVPLLPAMEPLWTHNDAHGSNLFWSDRTLQAEATAMVDFGLADRTCAVYDLATAIERNIIEWLRLESDASSYERVVTHDDHLRALLEGYESVRPLTDAEALALAPMTALCHAEYALSEADYYLGVLGSRASAALAYDGYLVGHARWFRSASGARLLESIRGWARQGARRRP